MDILKKKVGAFSRTVLVGVLLLVLNDRALYSMTRLYFEKDESLLMKILVLLVGMVVAILISAKVIYPQLLETEMDPFKARNIFHATVFAFLVLLFGITFHATIDILYFSIALWVIMIVWMLAAVIKK
ncbi:MAG: hypothetical protein PVH61_27605 [Candidatus Aminicenantes bacterium]|jgi:hypothetical protein